MKPTCLTPSKTVKSRCDGVYSADEACDESGTTSVCCTPQCQLKPGAVCSPVSRSEVIEGEFRIRNCFESTGSCCQSTCQFYPSSHVCLADSECKKQITCSGRSSTCPENDPIHFKPDKTVCGGGTLLCRNGSCVVSICALHSLRSCQLKEPESDLCLIACQTANGDCLPYHKIDPSTAKPLYLPCKSKSTRNSL